MAMGWEGAWRDAKWQEPLSEADSCRWCRRCFLQLSVSTSFDCVREIGTVLSVFQVDILVGFRGGKCQALAADVGRHDQWSRLWPGRGYGAGENRDFLKATTWWEGKIQNLGEAADRKLGTQINGTSAKNDWNHVVAVVSAVQPFFSHETWTCRAPKIIQPQTIRNDGQPCFTRLSCRHS